MNEFWDSFKAISYGLHHMGAAVYTDLTKPGFNFLPPDFGRPLIFSGVSSSYAPSTINDAEDIISKIMAQEKIGLADRDFYDLQTWKGYRGFKEGQYVFNRLNFKIRRGKICDITWREIKGLNKGFELLFFCLIGHNAKNISQQRD